jgi:hypothetical protein
VRYLHVRALFVFSVYYYSSNTTAWPVLSELLGEAIGALGGIEQREEIMSLYLDI